MKGLFRICRSRASWVRVVKTDVNHDGLHCWTKFLPQAHRRSEKPLALFCSRLWMRKRCPVLIRCVTNSPPPSFLSKDADWCGDFHQIEEIQQFRVKLWGGCARIQTYVLRLILSCRSDQSAGPLCRVTVLHLGPHHIVLLLCEATHLISRCGRIQPFKCDGSLTWGWTLPLVPFHLSLSPVCQFNVFQQLMTP